MKRGMAVLAFRELEAFASALLTVLLSLMRASIAREKSELLELAAQLGIEFNQSAGNSKASCPGLSADTPAVGEDDDIEPVRCFGRKKRLPHISAGRLVREIAFKGPVVDYDLAFAGPQEDTRGGRLSASGS